jgi:hypothetical protein
VSFSILAYRPSSVVHHLAPRNEACPLSLRDLLTAAVSAPFVLPIVRAPATLVARAALVAAKEMRSVLGLALPQGMQPDPWFAAMAETADAIAPGLPIFLSGRVTVHGAEMAEREAATLQAYKLVEAGITHLAVDVGLLPPSERAAAFAEVAAAGVEREIGLEYVVPQEDGVASAAPLFRALQGQATVPDLAGVVASQEGRDARAELERMAQFCAAFGRIPILCHSSVGSQVVTRLKGSPVKVFEDGGVAALAAAAVLPARHARELRGQLESVQADVPQRRAGPLSAWEKDLSADELDRAEARAYVETAGLIEALGAVDSARWIRDCLAKQADLG